MGISFQDQKQQQQQQNQPSLSESLSYLKGPYLFSEAIVDSFSYRES